MTIGVAILGSGIFARESHLPAIQACAQLNLLAVYSRSRGSAETLASAHGQDVTVYSDDGGVGHTLHDLLLRDDIAAVTIALPITAQGEIVEAALRAGKHVLSEKPIAPDIKGAEKLIAFYRREIDAQKVFWGVAENFRFMDSFEYAAGQVQRLGGATGFRTKVLLNTKVGGKYYETEWRKAPSYQGGFLLDGGVHFIAGTRLLLGAENAPTTVSAFTQLLQKHLPPIDTVNAIWASASGVSGTFSASFGTMLSGIEYTVSCVHGSVSVVMSDVTVREGEEKEGNVSVKSFPDEGNGVKQEIAAWAESIVQGKPNPKQSPEEALTDLEILEKMIVSGENGGQVQSLKYVK